MPNYFANLPAPEVRNALIDFSPIGQGFDSIRDAKQTQFRNALAQRQEDRAQSQFDYQRGRDQKQDQRQEVEWYGKQALAVDSMPDGPQRQAIWNRIIAKHGQDGLTPEEMDHRTGPKLLAAQAGMYLDPMKRQQEQAKLDLMKAQTAAANDTLAERREPKFATIGHDAYGNPSYGFVNPRTMQVTPSPAQSANAEASPQGSSATLSGDEFLKTLPKPRADQIRAIAEGRMPLPGGFALKTPYWQQMMMQVSQFDPNFDAVNYAARAGTRKDFTSGKSAQNITSFNTAIGHLDTLNHAIDKLENSNYPWLNAAANKAIPAMGGTEKAAALSNFEVARNAVKEELTRAFKGTGGSLTEVESWDAQIDSAKSPAALKAAVRQAVDLLASRINSVGEQYNKGMGVSGDPIKLLTPKAQETLARLNGESQTNEAQKQERKSQDLLDIGDGFTVERN